MMSVVQKLSKKSYVILKQNKDEKMKVTSVILLVAIDGKQQFHQVLLDSDEKENLVEMINKGLLTPNAKAIRVLDVPMVRRRQKREKRVENNE